MPRAARACISKEVLPNFLALYHNSLVGDSGGVYEHSPVFISNVTQDAYEKADVDAVLPLLSLDPRLTSTEEGIALAAVAAFVSADKELLKPLIDLELGESGVVLTFDKTVDAKKLMAKLVELGEAAILCSPGDKVAQGVEADIYMVVVEANDKTVESAVDQFSADEVLDEEDDEEEEGSEIDEDSELPESESDDESDGGPLDVTAAVAAMVAEHGIKSVVGSIGKLFRDAAMVKSATHAEEASDAVEGEAKELAESTVTSVQTVIEQGGLPEVLAAVIAACTEAKLELVVKHLTASAASAVEEIEADEAAAIEGLDEVKRRTASAIRMSLKKRAKTLRRPKSAKQRIAGRKRKMYRRKNKAKLRAYRNRYRSRTTTIHGPKSK